jgi:acyl-CoA hydrolase
MVQVSFTLPVPVGRRAEGAALQLAGKMGLDPAMVVHARAVGPEHTFFVVYGSAVHVVDWDAVRVPERAYPMLTAREVDAAIRGRLRRRLVVVGACIGTDAHTVGIDAILGVKGFGGEKGLEYHREMDVRNLGAQVTVPDLVERARRRRGAGEPGRHPAGRAPAEHRRAVGRPARRVPAGGTAAARRRRAPVRRRRGRRPGRGPRVREGHHARRGRELPRPRAGAPMIGLTVLHRRYVPYSAAHYAGHLVDGAYALGLFGDVATEVCIRTDGDEGLLASYTDVRFLAPVRAGDVLEATAEVLAVGTRSRTLGFRAVVVCRGGDGPAAAVLAEPLVAVTATGTVAVPPRSAARDTP